MYDPSKMTKAEYHGYTTDTCDPCQTPPSLRHQIALALEQAEKQVAECKRALALLDSDSTMQSAVEIVLRVTRVL